jgi:hypothetical protein
MTIEVELSPEVEAQLAAAAISQGVALEKYAGKLLQAALEEPTHKTGKGTLRPGDVEAMTKALTEGSEKLPVLTTDANERASYYRETS